LIQSILEVIILSDLAVLPEKSISVLGQQFGRLGGRTASGGVPVDKVLASLGKQVSYEML
jgi:hypothetical protein